MNIRKTRAFVTGAAGFIGSHLIEHLLDQGIEVTGLVLPGENLRWIKNLDISLVEGDITRKDSLIHAVRDQNVVYHLAAKMGGWSSPELLYDINTKGTKNLLEACHESSGQIDRFVFVSSAAVMGSTGKDRDCDESKPPLPESDYARSKLKAEEFVAAYQKNFPTTVVRLPLVYGPRSKRGLNVFFRMANRGISVFVGKTYTSVGYIKDIVECLVLVARSPKAAGQVYLTGEDRIYDSEEIIRSIADALGKKTIKLRVPYPLLYGFAALIEGIASLTKSHPIVRKKYLSEYLRSNWRFSMGKIRRDLGYTATTPLDEGLKLTAGWYKENGFKL